MGVTWARGVRLTDGATGRFDAFLMSTVKSVLSIYVPECEACWAWHYQEGPLLPASLAQAAGGRMSAPLYAKIAVYQHSTCGY